MTFLRLRSVFLLLGLCCLIVTGCEPVGHLAWSPDGSQAAYFVPMQGKRLPGSSFVLDPSGKVTKPLGPALGSFAWSADSKSLYFGGYDDKGPSPDVASRQWLTDAEDQPAANAPLNDDLSPMALNRWQNGAVERLAPLGNRYVTVVQASPDQSWIAVVAFAKEFDGDPGRYELFAYNTASKKLYEISEHCGTGVCFTAANKLAYVEADWEHGHPQSTGQIIEVQLDESAEHLSRTPLLDVMWEQTSDLACAADGLLFTTRSRTFPAIPNKQPFEPPVSLYHYTRANGGVAVIADFTGPLFLPSPDGKRILFIKITPPTSAAPEKQELSVMNDNGSDSHVLRDVSAFGAHLPFLPTWHGNDRITFISTNSTDIPAKGDQPERLAFDVVDYKLTDQHTLEAAQTLSQAWPMDMKPSMKASDYTAPTK